MSVETNEPVTGRSSPRWLRWLVIVGTIWGLLMLVVTFILEPTPENLTVAIAIPLSGLYTLALYLTRWRWLPLLTRRPLRNASLLGIAGAALVETIFLIVQHLTGAEGVAAHPNLLIDLLLTMPWYVLMVEAFVRVQNRRRFPLAVILLLGALYETGADGFLGPLIGLLFGSAQLLDPAYWLLVVLVAFWQFIPVYSAILLPPALLIEGAPPVLVPPGPAWPDALRPLFWLFPFFIYLLGAVLILGFLNPA